MVAGAAVLAVMAVTLLVPRRPAEDLSPYLYEDTRELVVLVEDAARLVEARGQGAFADFAARGSRWFNETYYVFVYGTDGTCLFHPVTPELVGKNRMMLRDIHGKPMIRLITQVGLRPEREAAGWVFYFWADRTQITPTWKSSYIRKAVGPDGRVYCVGSGLTNMKVEKVFVKERVELAAAVLEEQGREKAVAQLLDPASPFHFLDTFIFLMDGQGRSVIDPAFPTLEPRDLTGFRDVMGHWVIKEVLHKLEHADFAWIQYMRPRPGAILPSRKLLYVRKVVVSGETLIVGADFYLASPIWMRL
jgi:signal transduction histidine kinase